MRRVLIFGLCALLLLPLQELLAPKYQSVNPEGSLIGEYPSFAGGNDVIFIGDCEVYENFSPIALWEGWGIPSAIRGSPQQTIWQSYYLLEDTLRYEKPRVVIFNVLAMEYDTVESTGSQTRREAYNRMTLEGMAWSMSKVRAIFASQTEEEQKWESFFSYLFPILRYHDRWKELTQEDFSFFFRREPVSHNGYLMQTGVVPPQEAVQPPLTNPEFGENSWYYLEKITALCRREGIELVLIKAPSLYPVWHPQWEDQVQAYAAREGLLYINMTEKTEQMGIDWSRDTYDGGYHLNASGAEKAAYWLGSVLSRECALPDRRQDPALAQLWEEKCQVYHQQKLGG